MNSLLYTLRSQTKSSTSSNIRKFEFINGPEPLVDATLFYNFDLENSGNQNFLKFVTDIPGYKVWVNDELTDQNPGRISCGAGDKVTFEYDVTKPFSDAFSFYMRFVFQPDPVLSVPTEILTPLPPSSYKLTGDYILDLNCLMYIVTYAIVSRSDTEGVNKLPSRMFENYVDLFNGYMDSLLTASLIPNDDIIDYIEPIAILIASSMKEIPDDLYGGLENCSLLPGLRTLDSTRVISEIKAPDISKCQKAKNFTSIGLYNLVFSEDFFTKNPNLEYITVDPYFDPSKPLLDFSKCPNLKTLSVYSTWSPNMPSDSVIDFPEGYFDNNTQLEVLGLVSDGDHDITATHNNTATVNLPRNLLKPLSKLKGLWLLGADCKNTHLELELSSKDIKHFSLFSGWFQAFTPEYNNSCTIYVPKGSLTQQTIEEAFSRYVTDTERFKVIPVE